MRLDLFVILVILSCVLEPVTAQVSSELDSLEQNLKKNLPDTVRLDLLLDLAWGYARRDVTKALEFNRQADTLSGRLQWKEDVVDYYYGIFYKNQDDYDLGLFHLMRYLKTQKEKERHAAIANVQSSISTLYFEKGDYEQSMKYIEEALRFHQLDSNIRNQAIALNRIGEILMKIDRTDDGVNYFLQAIEMCIRIGDEGILANTHNNLANCYLRLKDYDQALSFYQLVKEYDEKTNYQWGLYLVNYNIANVYGLKNEWPRALELFHESFEIGTQVKQDGQFSELKIAMGRAYEKMGDFDRGADLLEEGLRIGRNSDDLETVKMALEALSEMCLDWNKFEQAYKYQSELLAVKDSIYNQEVATRVIEFDARYQTSEKERKITTLNAEREIDHVRLLAARNRNIGLLFGLGIFAILFLIISLFYLKVKKQRSIITDALSEKESLLQEIHHRVKNNLQVISSLLSMQSYQIEDARALDAVKESQNRVKTMALIHQNLYQDKDITTVDSLNYIDNLTESLFDSYNIEPDKIQLIKNIDSIPLDVDVMIPLGLILNELISNALKYAFQDGRSGVIDVQFHKKGDILELSVADNGVGLPEDFSMENATSLGLILIHDFGRKLKAPIEILNDHGTKIVLAIPYHKNR